MTTQEKSAGQRPNIIFIITDQQRFDTIRALGFDYMDTPNLDRLVNEGVTSSPTATSPRLLRAVAGQPLHRLLSAHHRHPQERRSVAALVGRTAGRERLHCINIGKMHTYPYHTPLGFHERYVVENKDRYLEERYYYDEWDKALHARGLVKQQRELYRQRPTTTSGWARSSGSCPRTCTPTCSSATWPPGGSTPSR